MLGKRVSCAKTAKLIKMHAAWRANQGKKGNSDSPRERVVLWAHVPTVTYIRMSAFRIVRVPPLAKVPAQRTRRTKPFVAARGDKTAMLPCAELLWTYIY